MIQRRYRRAGACEQ